MVSEPETNQSPVLASTATEFQVIQLRNQFPHLEDSELLHYAQYRATSVEYPPRSPSIVLTQDDLDEIILGIRTPTPGGHYAGYAQPLETPPYSPSPDEGPSNSGPTRDPPGPTGPTSAGPTGPTSAGPTGPTSAGPTGPTPVDPIAVEPTRTHSLATSSVWVPF